jgi:hypothetical protein
MGLSLYEAVAGAPKAIHHRHAPTKWFRTGEVHWFLFIRNPDLLGNGRLRLSQDTTTRKPCCETRARILFAHGRFAAGRGRDRKAAR